MKNNPNNNTRINDNEKGKSNLGFFQSIYRYLVNLIKKNPQKNDYELNKKLNDSINYYSSYYQNEINYHVENPSTSKNGLINLLNDCYIISFLQILFHIRQHSFPSYTCHCQLRFESHQFLHYPKDCHKV